MLGLRLRVHDVLRFSTKNSTNDRIISIFRRSSRAICRSPDSLQEMAGHRHPPVLRIAKYPGDWERGNLTKCESKCASPQSSPPNPATTCLVRFLVPNLCSYKRLANGAVKMDVLTAL